MTSPKKIFIFGPPGSGKSYWANEISKKLKIPIYDMDDVRFIKKFNKDRPEEKRKLLVDKILKNKKWVIDSKANDWNRHAMLKADLLLWICVPFYVRVIRIIKRYFRRSKNPKLEEGILDLFSLINYSCSYRFGRKPMSFSLIKNFLFKNKLKPISLKNKRQIKEFVESLGNHK